MPRTLLEDPGMQSPGHWCADASLLFCDVSGFTRLSEKLAKQGKSGAEELVTNLSNVYTALLTATDDGGDVLKFSGDAMVILFNGDDHQARAAHAAHGMRRALAEAGRIDSSHGRVRLRMSTGVHSGEFHLFSCGEDHLELLAAGPGVSATVAMESAADAGDVLLSPTTAAALDPRLLGAAKEGGVLLRRGPQLEPAGALRHPAVPDGVAARFVPALLRERLISEVAEDEHRQVTVAFLQFKGTDALLAEEGPARLFDRLQALTVAVQRATNRYGVCIVATDIDADGGKFMLTAGAPEASDDDEGRMLRACLEILDSDVPIPIRIGVNRGHLFAGGVGAPFRRTYSTMGDSTNLAARIMGKAPMGGLLAHRSVLEASSTRVVAEPVPPFMVKGKSRPVDASIVHLVTDQPDEAVRRLPITGRDDERYALRTMLDRAAQGKGAVVELVGDPGVGKSRLLSAVLESAEDVPTIRIVCDRYDRATAYGSARTLLRRALGIPDDADRVTGGDLLLDRVRELVPQHADFASLVAPLAGVALPTTSAVGDLAPRFHLARAHGVATDLLLAAAPRAVLVIDDAGAMDDASAAAIAHLLRSAPEAGWFVVLGRQDEPTGLHDGLGYTAHRMPLSPLGPDAVRELLRHAVADDPLPPRTLAAIAQRCGGNPLFLLELVAEVRGGAAGALPGSVEAILASRIDRLSIADRQALRMVSVLGTHAPADLVDATLHDEGLSSGDRARWARLSHFVSQQADGGLLFRSALHRDAAYEGLTFSRRRELHGRVASHLLGRADDPENQAGLSWHLHLAERWAEAYVHSVRAGDQARAAHAHAEAAESYRRALSAARHLDDVDAVELAQVGELLGDAEELASRYAEAAAAYRAARKLVPDQPLLIARLLRKEGLVGERAARYPTALRCYGRGLHVLDQIGPGPERDAVSAQLATGYAAVRFRQGQLRDCVNWARRAVAQADSPRERGTRAHAYYLMEAALEMLGDPGVDDVRGLALPLYEQAGDLLGQGDVLNNLGITAYYEGRWDESLALYERSRDAFRRVGDDVAAATAANNIAEILSDQGRLRMAGALLEEALSVWRAVDYPIGVALATSNLGRLRLREGDPAAALGLLHEACAGFEAIGSSAFVDETRTRLAEAYLARRRSVEAWEVASSAAAATADGSVLTATAERLKGLALLQTGGHERGIAGLRSALEQARELGAEYEVALCLDALARHDEEDRPERRAEASRIFTRLGVRAPVGVEISDGANALRVDVVADDTEREEAHASPS